MKIAIPCSGLDHIKRGIENSAKNLAYALKEKGLEVKLYKGSNFDSLDRDNSIEKSLLCCKRGSSSNRLIRKIRPPSFWHIGLGSEHDIEQTSFSLSFLLEALLKQYDIIHTKDPIVANVLNITSKLGLIKSKVIFSNGTSERAKFVNKFNYVQHLAPYHLQLMQDQNRQSKKWFAIPNLVDTKRFIPGKNFKLRKSLKIPKEAFVILSVGAIKHKIKRLNYLIKELTIFKENKNENAVFLIIVGSLTGETSDLISFGKRMLGNNIKFLLNQPYEAMPQIYRSADIFVLCSLYETFGTVLVESMASGIPTIAHKYPVMQWIVGAGGECIDMAQERELVKALEKYLNYDLRRKTSKKARAQAVNNFSKEVVVKQIIEMYRTVLNGR